jgi:hypothetical protein
MFRQAARLLESQTVGIRTVYVSGNDRDQQLTIVQRPAPSPLQVFLGSSVQEAASANGVTSSSSISSSACALVLGLGRHPLRLIGQGNSAASCRLLSNSSAAGSDAGKEAADAAAAGAAAAGGAGKPASRLDTMRPASSAAAAGPGGKGAFGGPVRTFANPAAAAAALAAEKCGAPAGAAASQSFMEKQQVAFNAIPPVPKLLGFAGGLGFAACGVDEVCARMGDTCIGCAHVGHTTYAYAYAYRTCMVLPL